MSLRGLSHPAARVGSLAVLFLGAALCFAQTNERPYSVEVGGGWTPPVGQLHDRFDSGWNVSVGGGWNATKAFNIGLKYMYNGFGVNTALLNSIGVPDGNAHVWSITADPRIQLPVGTRFGAYATGGVGFYRRTVNFTQPTVVPATFFDPFFGFFPGFVGANQQLGHVTRSGVGGSLGGGMTFRLGSTGAKVFTEARYHYADTGNIPTRMIPITVGIRF